MGAVAGCCHRRMGSLQFHGVELRCFSSCSGRWSVFDNRTSNMAATRNYSKVFSVADFFKRPAGVELEEEISHTNLQDTASNGNHYGSTD